MTTNVRHRSAYERGAAEIDIPVAIGRGIQKGVETAVKVAVAATPHIMSAGSAAAIAYVNMGAPAQIAIAGGVAACCNQCSGACVVQ
jgi:hypothetical protein